MDNSENEVALESMYEALEKADKSIVEKSLALQLRDFVLNDIPAEGGWPFQENATFDIGEKAKLTILVFGWNTGEKYFPIYIVGHKEE